MARRVERRTMKQPTAQSGFTLAEILIAVFILAVVMAIILGTFTGVISSAREAGTRSELYQTGRALMDLITTDIRCLYPQTGPDGGPFFQGRHESIEGEEGASMNFVTTNALTMGRGRNPFLTEVTYRLKKDSNGPGIALWRRAQSPAAPPLDEGGLDVPICRIIEHFRLEFVSKGDRKKDLIGVYPDAVVVEFALNLEGYRETFVTMVRPMVTIEETSSEGGQSPSG